MLIYSGIDIYNAIYCNRSTCGNLTELTNHDKEFLSHDIREEEDSLRLNELYFECHEEKRSKGALNTNQYPKQWTVALRNSIKYRDKFICQICSIQEDIISHHVHHIDYDKYNCCESNLITLCPSCHMKTNGKRHYWMKYFGRIAN